jgi:DNA-binding MarR family transcriptional regulator
VIAHAVVRGYSVQIVNTKQREEALTLELLEAIEQRDNVTQRHLASRMGVALGLTNSYLKRCVRKGLVKVQQAPANRYLYYLTPKGFAEKSRLTGEYLSYSFSFYRRASRSCAETLRECRDAGHTRVGLYGDSDLAEIAAVQAYEVGLEIACLCDATGRRTRFISFPVVHDPRAAPPLDAWLLTVVEGAAGAYEQAIEQGAGVPVYVPSLLGIARPDSQ